MKLKKGDSVIVVSGKNRGKQGKVLKSFPSQEKLVIEGVNLVKKKQRPKKSGQKGQVVEIAMPINVSNAMLFCSKCKKGVRVGAKITGDIKKRICRSCGVEI